METKAAKKLLKLIKFPSTYSSFTCPVTKHMELASWSRRGGLAGNKTILAVLAEAKKAGWKPLEGSSKLSPDGYVASSTETLVSPEGVKLSYHRTIGATRADNWYELNVHFPAVG